MIRVGVSGACGRMGRTVAAAVAEAGDLELSALYNPDHEGEEVAGARVSADPSVLGAVDVVVEFTRPGVVMGNLERWADYGLHAVVGTSGFDADRVEAVRSLYGEGPPNCLIVPNFSIGAVLMMRMAELAAPHFAAAEVIELHHDRKADSPSGTAVATAERLGGALPAGRPASGSEERVAGARGAEVAGVRVHAVRLPGLVAHQEVLFGNPGEVLTIRHDSTDRSSFLPGVLLGIRSVPHLRGVTVGLDQLI